MRRALTAAVITAVGYYAGVRLGLAFAVTNHSISAIWPPSGVALAALYLEGRHLKDAVWIVGAIFCAALAGNLSTGGAEASWSIAVGNTAEAVAGVLLLRWWGFAPDFRREVHVLKFAAAALLCCTVAATIGTLDLNAVGNLPWSSYGVAWRTWWLGDATGVLIVAPIILLVGMPGWRPLRTAASVAVAALALASAILTDANVGPFVNKAGVDYALLNEQLVMGALALAALMLAAVLARQRAVRAELAEAISHARELE